MKEWMRPELADNYSHRHLSHIYPVFPGTEITKHAQPKIWEAFRKAVALRELGAQSGWSLAHMACIWARMGEAERAAECLDGMAKAVIMDSLFTTHNDWRAMGTTMQWNDESYMQLDAAFGAVNAIQEMLFSPQKDALSILPACPARLRAGNVRGIVFPEGTADISWTETGTVTVTISAHREVNAALLLEGKERGRIRLAAGETETFHFNKP